MISRRFIISGQVQGVGYRYFAHRSAARINLSGYVKNLPDGRVEVVGQGTENQLTRLYALLKQGPAMARVDDIEVTESADVGYSDFSIKH